MENDFNIDPMMRESPDEMRKTLDKNYKNIVDAFIHQSTENYDDSLECIMKSVNTLKRMITIADSQQPHTQMILKEQREILPQFFLQNYEYMNYAQNSYSDQMTYNLLKNYMENMDNQTDVKKRKKEIWNEHESGLFKDALEKYGPKDLKRMSEHIGTRTVSQVRSKLQKYNKRLEKLKLEEKRKTNCGN